MTERNDIPLPEDLKEVIGFHGHVCPGLVLGYRAAKAGMAALGSARSEDEELVAIVENDACGVDAVQFLTGCTFGKGNLFFRDYGKQVFTFGIRPSGRAVRVSVRAEAGSTSDRDDLPKEERWVRRIRDLLDMETGVLLKVEERTVELPRTARVHQSVICDACGEKVMPTRVREVDGRRLCIPCSGGAA